MAGHIVVGVDGSAAASAAVEWAAEDARRKGLGLRVVHVCASWPAEHAAGRCAEALAAAGERAGEAAGDLEVTTELLQGNVIERLLAESATAAEVVLGSRGLGEFQAMLVGSVSLAVAGHAAGPAVIVRDAAATRHGRVVVGYDRSEHAETAMQYAVDHARAHGARLHVLHAWRTPLLTPHQAAYNSLLADAYQEETRDVAESVASWREKNPDLDFTHETATGHPVDVLARAGATADLVVVGSRGLGGFASAVLGSVSHGVLHHVTCPVAVVRPRHEGTLTGT
ncbi:universal stress protein [Nonomuraea sp. FMUSA5-5]|uniref:Universal stress protein n=1 Tax=Nonomuraea composti TaxID=2720023 RepID=A0ABX1ASY5_9ACTN|nr:universal stress protein [Nonomuraea sp. FMUSA5-5]NJP88718.1 universal stress protein [Nonomuraea sp. FMUSA5-5]